MTPWFRGRESTLNNSRHSERLQRGHAALNNSRNHMFPMCITLWVSLWEIGGFQKLCTLNNSRELISLKSMT